MHGRKNDADFPLKSEIRKWKLNKLKSKLTSQQQLMVKPRLQNITATIASFKISNIIAKNSEPFTKGEFVKDCFLVSADNLFEGFKNKKEIIAAFQDVQLQEILSCSK
ncbi:hypothetical protein JRQ81_014088 [Phrynocephalus forsythii]|uniref:Uncharacterized protein n=1 Tax=Phrynocephalus forsythii TaxID=171643 RepID=A0A9Q0XW22_9SAUR|nr:hypothetical protein JRQ81_014088 [Phrynocephalus forsythii]